MARTRAKRKKRAMFQDLCPNFLEWIRREKQGVRTKTREKVRESPEIQMHEQEKEKNLRNQKKNVSHNLGYYDRRRGETTDRETTNSPTKSATVGTRSFKNEKPKSLRGQRQRALGDVLGKPTWKDSVTRKKRRRNVWAEKEGYEKRRKPLDFQRKKPKNNSGSQNKTVPERFRGKWTSVEVRK